MQSVVIISLHSEHPDADSTLRLPVSDRSGEVSTDRGKEQLRDCAKVCESVVRANTMSLASLFGLIGRKRVSPPSLFPFSSRCKDGRLTLSGSSKRWRRVSVSCGYKKSASNGVKIIPMSVFAFVVSSALVLIRDRTGLLG